MTLPIGGADMPVVISLYNAMTGLAVAFEGYVLGIEALIIAGMVGRRGRHDAHAVDGESDESPDQRRAVQ
jgi:NAD/NADP transhydrogenase beta subunit